MTSRLPTPGSDDGTWGYVLNDFLSQSLASDGTLIPSSVTEAKLAPVVVTKLNSTNGVVISNTPSTSTQVLTATGSTSAAWSAPATSLTSIAAQTASFTAVAGFAYPINTASGVVTVTLPTSTGTSGQLAIKKATSDTNVVTIAGTINGVASSSLNLTLLNEAKVFIADGSGGWNTFAGDNQLSQLDTRYLQNTQAAGGNLSGTYPNPTVQSATIKSSNFTLQDATDTTKQLQFDVSAVATGTTITPQWPNSNSQIANVASTQTLTNKTMSSPILNTPIIQYLTVTQATAGATTLTTAQRSSIFYINATTGSQTINLPNTTSSGLTFRFIRVDNTVAAVTLTALTSPTFDNPLTGLSVTSLPLNQLGSSIEISTTAVSGSFKVVSSYTAPTTVAPGGFNLISNADMQLGTVGYGIANGASLSTGSAQFRTGARSLVVTFATNASDNGVTLYSVAANTLPVNRNYIEKAWVYVPTASAPTNGGVRLSVQGTGTLNTPVVSNYTTVKDQWVEAEISFTTAATSGTILFYLLSAGTTAGQFVYVADVSLQDAGTALVTSENAQFVKNINFADATNIALGASAGTMIGTAGSQKLGFFGVTPATQQLATTELGTALSNLGLRASGTSFPITTSGAVNFTGTTSISGAFSFSTTGSGKTGNLNISGSQQNPVTSLTANASITISTGMNILADATTASFTVTLPNTAFPGIEWIIKKIDSSVNTVTIIVATSGTIDGASSVVLSAQYKLIRVITTTATGVMYITGSN